MKAGINLEAIDEKSHGKRCSVEEVISFIKSRRPTICPNEGFMAQLQMWGAMDCRLESAFIPYKLYQLDCIYNQLKQTKILPSNIKSFFQVRYILGTATLGSIEIYSLLHYS